MNPSVIENVHAALHHGNTSPALSQRPAIYPARQPGSVNTELQQFFTEIQKLSAVGQLLKPNDISEAINSLVRVEAIRKATLWNSPWLKDLGIARQLVERGVELISPNANKQEIASCDLGITEADYLLPETGTIVLKSSGLKPRAVSLLPRIHLAIVTPESLRADMHQVFAEVNTPGDPCPYLVFITGPSRTADIELTVTLGVHGPKELLVWMIKG